MNLKQILITTILLLPVAVHAEITGADKKILTDKFASIGFTNKADIDNVIAKANVLPEIIKKQNNAAEKRMTIERYLSLFHTESKMALARRWMEDNKTALSQAEEAYGVDREIIAAILLIETKYNSVRGKYRVIDAIVTRIIKNPKLSPYFTKQIPSWVKICKEQGFNITDKKGSYAGAMGMPQFMPSSFTHYAADGDGDGEIDIWENTSDTIASVANYFHKHHWTRGQLNAWSFKDNGGDPRVIQGRTIYVKSNIDVIRRYNTAMLYAMAASIIYDDLKNTME